MEQENKTKRFQTNLIKDQFLYIKKVIKKKSQGLNNKCFTCLAESGWGGETYSEKLNGVDVHRTVRILLEFEINQEL